MVLFSSVKAEVCDFCKGLGSPGEAHLTGRACSFGSGMEGELSAPRAWKGLTFVAGKYFWLWVHLIKCKGILKSDFKVYILVLWNLHPFYLPLLAECLWLQ